jgi:hypothetical protein
MMRIESVFASRCKREKIKLQAVLKLFLWGVHPRILAVATLAIQVKGVVVRYRLLCAAAVQRLARKSLLGSNPLPSVSLRQRKKKLAQQHRKSQLGQQDPRKNHPLKRQSLR